MIALSTLGLIPMAGAMVFVFIGLAAASYGPNRPGSFTNWIRKHILRINDNERGTP